VCNISVIRHRKSATSEPAGTSANRRWQVANVDVVKIELAHPDDGGGGAAAAARRRQLIAMLKTGENRPPTAVNSTTNHCPCPGYG